MKKAITAITLFDLVFMLLLSVSGSVGGVFGNIIYYLAFVIPIFLAFIYLRGRDYEANPTPLKLLPDLKSIVYTLPLIAPFISAVFALSFLTSLLLNLLGFSSVTDVSGNLFGVIIKHAAIPSVFEEAVFRFIPIMLLLPYSKKNAVVISSVMFAAVHCNLFQIPYALIASFVLSFVAIATGNIFPCILLHFLNNLASIAFMRCSEAQNFNLIFFLSLAVLTLASAAVIFFKREKYKKALTEIKEDKCNVEFASSTVIFVGMAIVIGVINLWMRL